ncbi:MAG TPA: CHAT domain-containing protein, partial [Pyrinomonadaceae bacterium]|nr:CHAT domain-containing protein [Pyrinomonadaceae bacterium]
AEGRTREAEKFFEASIDAAENARAPLPAEAYRLAFFAKTIEPYNNLTRLHLSAGNIEQAFATVERSRSRVLSEAIAGPKRAEVTPSIAKLREELNWFYTRLSREDGEDVARLQNEIRRREKTLASETLRNESLRRSRRAKSSITIDVAGLRSRLGRENALIEFIEDGGLYSAFVVTHDGVAFVESIASIDEIRSLLEGLHFQFGTLRFGGDAIRSFAGQLKARANAYLRELYRKLIEPLAEAIGDRDLVFVPAGALNYVPFNALFDGERYLIESRKIVCAPSASIWASLNSRPTSQPAHALLMAYADEKIPLANDEVKNLGRVLPKATRFTGKRATFAAFQENAPRADLIHLACHGQYRPDNPLFSSLHLADGWVTVRDVTAISLKAKLVTLSACETGLNEVFAGEELLGLARGFLSAGARSLVLSLWTVNDDATSRLMRDLYQNLQRGQSIAASLRVAQLKFIENGEHPYFWSPFFLIG